MDQNKFDAHNEIHNAGNRVIHHFQTKLKAKDKAIALLSSMVEGGERHSETSRQVVKQALKG